MQITSLKAQTRTDIGKRALKVYRSKNVVPGIVYGAGADGKLLILNEHELKVFVLKYGENSLVDLVIDGKTPVLAVISEVQHHPLTEKVLHVDFKQVPRDMPVELIVSIEFFGIAKGAKAGGIVVPRLHDLNVRATPNNMPDKIKIDISELDFGQPIHVKDLPLIEGVEFIHEQSETVASLVRPKIEEVKVAEEVVEEGAATEEETKTSDKEKKAPEKEKKAPEKEKKTSEKD